MNNEENTSIQSNVEPTSVVESAPVMEPTPTVEQPVQPVVEPKKEEKPKKGKGKIVLIIGLILLVVIGIVLFLVLKPSSDNKEYASFGSDTIIKVKSNGKYGYINSNGDIVINVEYDDASDFVDGYAYIGKGYSYSREYAIIDTNGKTIKQFSNVSKIEYYPDLKLWLIDNKLYDSSFKDITPDGVTHIFERENNYFHVIVDDKDAIMDTTGKITWSYINTDVVIYIPENDPLTKEAYCLISDVELDVEEIINCDTGKVVREFAPDIITSEGNNVFEIRSKTGTTDIFVAHDEIIHELGKGDYYVDHGKYGYLEIHDKEYNADGYATFDYIYIDLVKGEVVKDKPSYEQPKDEKEKKEYNSSYSISECDEGYYGLSYNNKSTIKCEYDELERFDADLENYLISQGKPYILGYKDDNVYLLNMKTGKKVTTFDNNSFEYGYTTFVYYNDYKTNKTIIYNLVSGKSTQIDTDKITTYPNYITVKHSNGKIDYYNSKLKVIFTTE